MRRRWPTGLLLTAPLLALTLLRARRREARWALGSETARGSEAGGWHPARRRGRDAAYSHRRRPGLCAGDEGRRGEAWRTGGVAVVIVVVVMIVVAAVVAIIVATIVVASSTASAAIEASASASASASVATTILVSPNSSLFALGEDGGWELDALEQFGLVSVGGGEGRHFVVNPSNELVRWFL